MTGSLQPHEPLRPPGRVTPLLLGVVALSGLVVTFGAFAVTRRLASERVAREFDQVADERIEAVRRQLLEYHWSLESVVAYFGASANVERSEFARFVTPLLARQPYLRALEWVPRVRREEVGSLVERASREGLRGFRVTERDASGGLQAATDRSTYYPALWVEPLAGNELIVGFDFGSDAERLATLAAARDRASLRTTGPLRSLGSDSDATIFVTVVPVYRRTDRPESLAQRRRELMGFVAGVLSLDRLFERSLRDRDDPELTMVVREPAARDRLIHRHGGSASGAESDPALAATRDVDAGGRVWSITCISSRGFASISSLAWPWLVLVVGLGGTTFVLLYLVREDARGRQLAAANVRLAEEIRERERIREQLLHSQKLESLGVLAGGIAHDFNNLLTGILGGAALAQDSLPPDSPARPLIERTILSSERAAALTRQLLAYAGKGTFELRRIELSQHVREITGLLEAATSRKVRLQLELGENLPPVEGDPGQIQQLVMNVVINGTEACHAGGGTVVVSTAATVVAPGERRSLVPGPEPTIGVWVLIEVRDDGCGMDPATQQRIFDPFFTTKFTGRGLGLAAVLGIVRAHGGCLDVESEPGRGSRFAIWLPATERRAEPRREPPAVPAPPALITRGTILVVDDDETVRELARGALERWGFDVVTARDGREGVETYREHPGEIDLVLLDMTMPVMSGEEAFDALRRIDPAVRVLLTSGYDEVEATRHFVGAGLAGFIQKPYRPSDLAAKVRSALGQPSQPG